MHASNSTSSTMCGCGDTSRQHHAPLSLSSGGGGGQQPGQVGGGLPLQRMNEDTFRTGDYHGLFDGFVALSQCLDQLPLHPRRQPRRRRRCCRPGSDVVCSVVAVAVTAAAAIPTMTMTAACCGFPALVIIIHSLFSVRVAGVTVRLAVGDILGASTLIIVVVLTA